MPSAAYFYLASYGKPQNDTRQLRWLFLCLVEITTLSIEAVSNTNVITLCHSGCGYEQGSVGAKTINESMTEQLFLSIMMPNANVNKFTALKMINNVSFDK